MPQNAFADPPVATECICGPKHNRTQRSGDSLGTVWGQFGDSLGTVSGLFFIRLSHGLVGQFDKNDVKCKFYPKVLGGTPGILAKSSKTDGFCNFRGSGESGDTFCDGFGVGISSYENCGDQGRVWW